MYTEALIVGHTYWGSIKLPKAEVYTGKFTITSLALQGGAVRLEEYFDDDNDKFRLKVLLTEEELTGSIERDLGLWISHVDLRFNMREHVSAMSRSGAMIEHLERLEHQMTRMLQLLGVPQRIFAGNEDGAIIQTGTYAAMSLAMGQAAMSRRQGIQRPIRSPLEFAQRFLPDYAAMCDLTERIHDLLQGASDVNSQDV